MRPTLRILLAAPLIFLFARALDAQRQTPYVTGSTVSGHVICSDTNGPARFARIMLKPVTPSQSGQDMLKTLVDVISTFSPNGAALANPQTDDQKRALTAITQGLGQATDLLGSSTVGLDGSYSFVGVQPGTYYIHVVSPGYLDLYGQFRDEDFTSSDPKMRARLAQIPSVTVNGTDSARVNLTLERGGAISGRIRYDDGSPAYGWTISVVQPKAPEDVAEATLSAIAPALAVVGAVPPAKSDDLGRFRISGLPAGEYDLRASFSGRGVGVGGANLNDGGSGINLAVYSGDTFNRSEAKSLKIHAGDEITGQDITIPATRLHSIVGHVVAKSDGHTVNTGQVLLSATDTSGFHAMAAIRDDGSFHFECLPSDVTYSLTVANAADAQNNGSGSNFFGVSLPNPDILRKYGSDSTTILLPNSDSTSVTLSVDQTDWKPTPSDPNPSVGQAEGEIKKLLGGTP
jgi:hypothetical protein